MLNPLVMISSLAIAHTDQPNLRRDTKINNMSELQTDDEVLRESGMTDGKRKVGNITLRPMTALSLSWLQRNHVFDDETGDTMSKTAAFVYLHSQPKELIRAVVNNRSQFLNAVDEWIDKNIPHHSALEPYSDLMSESMNAYLAAVSTSANPSEETPGAKN